MSIAASVVVLPSRLLLVTVGLLCAGVCTLGAMFACGAIADISLPVKVVCALVCIVSALAGFLHFWRQRRTYQLDITGTGQIRLSYLHSGHISAGNSAQNTAVPDGMLVTLLADSTLWPGLLMLRLKSTDNRVFNVPILPDSLPPASFRAVAVACRWISGHDFAD